MKEQIIGWLKVCILITAMSMGFYLGYCFIWYAIGLPLTNWAMGILVGLAALTEYGYYLWIRE